MGLDLVLCFVVCFVYVCLRSLIVVCCNYCLFCCLCWLFELLVLGFDLFVLIWWCWLGLTCLFYVWLDLLCGLFSEFACV